ncbi:hypothetical protein MAPG_00237 [Magnaporthiopsis poae ATCC 64411]|uniref:Uncharacterized protein n=1 Tax=Magnaporthiopsis poae (strain ATCC 64411 / 73-15) TaxID=644358 RepID=A0A0C4DKG5_MAGP6|nr:hypothetical protein MAPG_00237 [Magnaporthiopsis poae ATCC 64411]
MSSPGLYFVWPFASKNAGRDSRDISANPSPYDGDELRNRTAAKGYRHIGFSRLEDPVHEEGQHKNLKEAIYIRITGAFRQLLVNSFGWAALLLERANLFSWQQQQLGSSAPPSRRRNPATPLRMGG